MDTRFRIFLIAAVGLIAVAVWTFPRWWPLLRPGDTIEEVFPGLALDLQDEFINLPREERESYFEMLDADPAMALAMVQARLNPRTLTTPEAMPENMDEMVILRSGTFGDIDAIHRGSGRATVYQLPDQGRQLVVEDFIVTNGPNLHLIFTRDPNPLTGVEVGQDYIDLGPLKATTGDQLYDLPAGLDLDRYQAVVVYCLAFGVVFSVAPLR